MNISNQRSKQTSFQTHHNFYFLLILIIILFIDIEPANGSLYSQFNGKLDLLSSLAEKKVKAEVQPTLDEIYQKSAKLLDNPFVDVLDEENIDNMQKMTQIEKLVDALEPYSSPNRNPSRKRILQHQDSQSVRTIGKDRPVTERKYRTIFDGSLKDRKSIIPESNTYTSLSSKWPAAVESGAVDVPTKEKFIMSPNPLNSVYRRSWCPVHKVKKRSKKLKQIRKRFYADIPHLDPRPVMNSASSSYPGVIAKAPELPLVNMASKVAMNGPSSSLNFDVNALAAAASSLSNPAGISPVSYPNLNQIKDIQQILQSNSRRQVNDSLPDMPVSTSSKNCDQTISANVSDMLERVLSDLDAIKNVKMGNLSADGTPCKISGFWNSEIAGVRFDLTVQSNATNCPFDLGVQINKRRWKRKDSMMDSSWSCSGKTLRRIGGPFYLAARKEGDSGMATFTGFCMSCGGSDIVFGAWIFVNPCRNCTDVSLSIDMKRDIFRRDMEEEKKARQKEEKGKTKLNKIGCLKDKSEECEQNELENGFSPNTFYEYF